MSDSNSFNLSKDKSMLADMNALFAKKRETTNRFMQAQDDKTRLGLKKELLSMIDKKQLQLIKFLYNDSSSQFIYLLDQAAKHLAAQQLDILEKLGKLNKTRELILLDSLEMDLKKIIEVCKSLQDIYMTQASLLTHDNKIPDKQSVSTYKEYFDKESIAINTLNTLLAKNSDLEKNINEHIRMVQELEYNKGWAKIIKRAAKLFVLRPYAVIVTGLENIPMTGPVVIASRHYHGDVDGGLLINVLPRRTFILANVDWIPNKFMLAAAKFTFPKIGEIAMNRPDAPTKREDYPNASMSEAVRKVVSALHLNQAVLMFPEGWPNIDSHRTPKKLPEGILPLKPGLVRMIELAQKSIGSPIPIIPVGLIYTGLDTPHVDKTIEVNFGKPMYYIGASDDAKREIFGEKLRTEIVRLSRS